MRNFLPLIALLAVHLVACSTPSTVLDISAPAVIGTGTNSSVSVDVAQAKSAVFLNWTQVDTTGPRVTWLANQQAVNPTFSVASLSNCSEEEQVTLQVQATDAFGNVNASQVTIGVKELWCTYKTPAANMLSNIVTRVAANNGVIWVGTDSGLNRFDGINWQAFTEQSTASIAGGLAANQVRALAVTSNDDVWVAVYTPSRISTIFDTVTGVNVYHDKTKTWQHFTKGANELNSNTVYTLALAEPDMLVGTDTGVSTFQLATTTWSSYSVVDKVRAITRSLTNQDWLGTDGGVFVYSDGQKVTQYDNTATGGVLVRSLITGSFDFRAAITDGQGSIWFGEGAGVARYLAPQLQGGILPTWKLFTAGAVGGGPASNDIRAFALDGNGNLWIATGGGLSTFFITGANKGQWNSFSSDLVNTPNGLQTNDVRDVTYDSENNYLWIGTNGGGLTRYWLGG